MKNIPTNLRLPESLHTKLAHAAESMDLPIADVARQALALGIRDLELIGFNVEKVLHEAVIEARKTAPGGPQLLPTAERHRAQKKA
jgi:hypothetical protein